MTTKTFDAVAFMREARARRERDYGAFEWDALCEAIHERAASDPLWQRFASRAGDTHDGKAPESNGRHNSG